jgi:hypothetical protein
MDYSASWDESVQLYSAKKLVNGEGLTNIKYNTDLSNIEHEYLTLWPPGHSLLVSCFMKLGISLNLSAKIIKIIFVLLCCVLWSFMAQKFIRATILQVSFLAVIAKFSFLFLLYYSTDFFVFSVFPALILIAHDLKSKNEAGLIKRVLTLGLLTSFLIILKYTALVIPIIFNVFLIKLFLKQRRKLIQTIFYYSILPIITYSTIFIINKINTDQGNLINLAIPQKALINNLGSLPYCLFQFVNPLLIKTIPGANSIISKLNISDFIVFIIVVLFIIFVYSKNKITHDSDIKPFFLVSLISSFMFFLLLSLIMYYQVGGKDWWPLIELRYFSYLPPLFSILLICFIDNQYPNKHLKIVFFIFMTGASLIYIIKNINAERLYITNYANDKKDIAMVLNSDTPPKNNDIIISYQYFPQVKLVYATPVIAVAASDISEFIEKSAVSNEISIYLIYSKNEVRNADSRFLEFIEKYEMTSISNNNVICYKGSIQKK